MLAFPFRLAIKREEQIREILEYFPLREMDREIRKWFIAQIRKEKRR